MEDAKGQISDRAATVYEELFVPALFGQWPAQVSNIIGLRTGQRVLDVACGTGVMARFAATVVGSSNVDAMDINEGMLSEAKRLEPGIRWEVARAEALPYRDTSFDAVTSLFGVMFFESRTAALQEMWRVLKPGGELAVLAWSTLEESSGYFDMVKLLERLFGTEIANELRAPFVLGDSNALRGLAEEAGIPDAEVSTLQGSAHFPSLQSWVHTDIKGWTLAEKLNESSVALLQQAAAKELTHHIHPDGVRFPAPARLLKATKPN